MILSLSHHRKYIKYYMNNFNQNNMSQNIPNIPNIPNPQNIMQQHLMRGAGPQQPIEIESDLILYVLGGMLAYNFYNKYVSNNIFKYDHDIHSDDIANITNTTLNFNK